MTKSIDFKYVNTINQQNFWEIQLLRQREEILPGISYEDGTYELINLPEGQYLAESSTFIYDSNSHIVLFQRNRFGYSINALLNFIKTFYPPDTNLHIKPIMKQDQIERIKDSCIYRKFQLVSDGSCSSLDEGSNLHRVLKEFGVYQGNYITIEVSMGHIKSRNLKAKPTAELIREAYYSNSTTFLRARIADSTDTQVETIDLLKDRESIILEINYSKEAPITHDRLFEACKSSYIRRTQD